MVFLKSDQFYFFIIFFSSLILSTSNIITSESVLFSKAFLGNVEFNFSNDWLKVMLTQPKTLQIHLTFFLMKIGIDSKIVNFFYIFLCNLISLYSVFYFSKIFTKSNFLSFLVSVVLINHNFVNTHWYGIHYPNSFFFFGQLGMYLLLLSIGLQFNNYKNFSYIVCIVNFFSHFLWGFWNLIFIILCDFIRKKKFLIINFLSFFILFLGLFLVSVTKVQKSVDNLFKYNDQEQNLSEEKTLFFTNLYEKDKKLVNSKVLDEVFKEHNPKLIILNDFSHTFFNFFRFYFFEIILIFIFIFFRYFKRLDESQENIFKIFLIATSLIIIYKIVNFFFLNLYFLNFLYSDFSNLINRAHIDRLLNINNIFVIIFIISYFFKYIFNQNTYLITIIFCLFFLSLFIVNIFFNGENIYTIFKWKYFKYIDFYNLVIYSAFPLILLLSFKYKNKIKIQNYYYKFALVFLFFMSFFFTVYKNYKVQYDDVNKINLVKNLIEEKSQEMILAPYVYGVFDPSYYFNKPFIVPSKNYPIKDFNGKNVDIFCLDDLKNIIKNSDQFYEYVESCIFKRSEQNWNEILEFTNIYYMVVPKKVFLKLKLLVETSKVKIYYVRQKNEK